MRRHNFYILLLFSLTSFAAHDTISNKGNYHCGIFIENKYLSPQNFGRFNFKSVGLQAGFKSLQFHFSINFFNKEKFQNNNYLLGDRDKRKTPLGGFNTGFTIIPYYHKKKFVKLIYKFDYYNSNVYGGSKTLYEFSPGYFANRTYNFDDKFESIFLGSGLQLNYRDFIAIQATVQVGINYQSSKNSHFKEYIYISNSYDYTKKDNAFLIGISLHYKIHSNGK
jgi:hypothetical protein